MPIFLILLVLNANLLNAQANDTEAALYNVGFGAVFSTLGAVINKSPEEPVGKVIKKALWQGALGGYVTFESKRLLREAQRHQKWEYVWGAKLVNAAGTSIKENAALNNDFWEKWHINFGFNRIEFTTQDKLKVRYRLLPVALIYTADAFFRYDFDFKQSFRTGEFVFSYDANQKGSIAFAGAGIIVYDRSFLTDFTSQSDIFKSAAHEIIHLYQSNDFSVFNTFIYKPMERWSKQQKTVKWINTYLYPEYHYLILRPAYLLEEARAKAYYDNFFEHEAGYYSDGLH
ncbi:MAG: hypothetical protein ACPF95_00845 [Flavobacteriaceae bacterium]